MKRTQFLILACAFACASQDNKQVAATQDAAASPASETATGAPSPGDTSDPRLVKADLSRIQGSASAKVWFVIVSDFQCPYCKQWHDTAGEALRREYVNTGKIRVAYVNYPLGQHQQAVPTAEAAMCAGIEGKFWQYHDALFATQTVWQELRDATGLLDSIATAVGVNLQAHKECRQRHAMLPLIVADRDRAQTAGARSTPTFIVGGQTLSGVYPMSALRPILDAAVAQAR